VSGRMIDSRQSEQYQRCSQDIKDTGAPDDGLGANRTGKDEQAGQKPGTAIARPTGHHPSCEERVRAVEENVQQMQGGGAAAAAENPAPEKKRQRTPERGTNCADIPRAW